MRSLLYRPITVMLLAPLVGWGVVAAALYVLSGWL